MVCLNVYTFRARSFPEFKEEDVCLLVPDLLVYHGFQMMLYQKPLFNLLFVDQTKREVF